MADVTEAELRSLAGVTEDVPPFADADMITMRNRADWLINAVNSAASEDIRNHIRVDLVTWMCHNIIKIRTIEKGGIVESGFKRVELTAEHKRLLKKGGYGKFPITGPRSGDNE